MKLLIIFAIFYAILSTSNVIAAENIDCSTIKNENKNSLLMNKSIDTNSKAGKFNKNSEQIKRSLVSS